MTRLLNDHELADRLGAAGHARVVDQFLGDRHLAQYVELFARLASMPTGQRPHPRVRVPRDPADDYTSRRGSGAATSCGMRPAPRWTTSGGSPSTQPPFPATSRTSSGRRRSRSVSPGPSASRANTPAATSTSHSRRDRRHPGGELQPGDAAPHRMRRGHDRGRRRAHAAGTRVHPGRRLACGPSESGSTSSSRKSPRRPNRRYAVRQADRDRAVRRRSVALPPLRLHDRRRRRAEPHRQGDPGGVRMDPGQPSRPPAIHPVRLHRHRQEALADQHAADARAGAASSPKR